MRVDVDPTGRDQQAGGVDLPRARGEASHIRQEAEAYRAQVVNLAHGEADAFLPLLKSYEEAKEVTAWRLYLDSVDQVLRKASKVIVDTSGKGVAGVTPYLPVTEFRPPEPQIPPAAGAPAASPPAPQPGATR